LVEELSGKYNLAGINPAGPGILNSLVPPIGNGGKSLAATARSICSLACFGDKSTTGGSFSDASFVKKPAVCVVTPFGALYFAIELIPK
jgi:hypothetical protein